MLGMASVLLLLAGLIIIRLLYIQVWERTKYTDMAEKQYIIEIPLQASRGEIYDRNLNYLVLNEPCISIGLDKHQMDGTSSQYAEALAPLLGTSVRWLRQRIRSVKGSFVWLRRRIDVEQGAKIAALNLAGIRVEKDTRRIYPHREIGGHIIGFTNSDNEGIAGSELQFNEVLSGRDGRLVIQRDGKGRAVPENVVERIAPRDGASIALTVDYILQTIASQELRRAVSEYNATSGMVVICNPQTGHILAVANEPSYDPNAPAEYSVSSRRNRAITDAFEPGSTYKIVTFSAALEAGLKTVDDLIYCENGVLQLDGRKIRDTNPQGWLTFADVLAYSSNIGTVKIAQELGAAKLYEASHAFGFGRQSGIPFPGETAGILRSLDKWTSFTTPSMAIGQEVAVNAIQMVMAYSAIANGGFLLQPKLYLGTVEKGRKLKPEAQRTEVRRVMSAETAATMKMLLQRVVEKGTGKAARIPGLAVAGKTGTAQEPLPGGKGYSTSEFLASFVGFFPVHSPKYLIFVALHTGKEHQWGSKTAAPTFKRIAQKIRVYDKQLQTPTFPADSNGTHTPAFTEMSGVILPNLANRRLEFVQRTLESMGLAVKTDGSGDFVLSQTPAAGVRVQPGQTVTLQLFEVAPTDGVLEMPDVVGLSLREAMTLLTLSNLDPVVYGHGVVVRQKPAAGSRVRAGIRCVIECEAPVSTLSSMNGIGAN